jgi:hypothetical protein
MFDVKLIGTIGGQEKLTLASVAIVFWAKSFVRFAKRLLGGACRNDRIHRLVPMDPRFSYQRFHRQPPRAGICASAAFATVAPGATGIADTLSGNTRQQISEAMNAM